MEAGAPLTTSTTDFVECYLVHYRRLVRALRLGGADPGTAEELAQEAFARALPRWRRISQGVNPAGYVYTTGFRLLQRSLRRSSRWDIGDPPEVAEPGDPPDRVATTAVAVEAALALMPPKRRACAVMCLIVGLSVREAGEALHIADGTVRKHLEEARRDLQFGLGDQV
jgi:RNA polymerase sigma-70 factor (ECF subfamily)